MAARCWPLPPALGLACCALVPHLGSQGATDLAENELGAAGRRGRREEKIPLQDAVKTASSFLRSLLPNFVLPEAILEMEGGAGSPSSASPPCHGAVSGLKSPPATGETQGPIFHLQSPFLVRPALRSAAPRARSPPWDFFFPTQWCSLRCSIPARTSRTSLYSDRKQVEKGGWQQKHGAVNTKQDSATGEREKVPQQRMGQGKSTKVRAPQPGRVAVGPLLRGGTWSQAAVAQGSPPHQHPIPSGFSKPTTSWCTRGSLPHPSGPHNSAPPPQT